MQAPVIIVDDFLRNPESLTKESQKLKYERSVVNPSNRVSSPSKFKARLHTKVSQYVGQRIEWDPSSATYRKTTEDEVIKTKNQFFCHSDGITDFVALLYLTRPKECHGGTAFYRHKESGLEGIYDHRAVLKFLNKTGMSWEDFVKKLAVDARVPSKWVQTDFFQMKYNRVIIYNGAIFHSRVFDFKKVKKKSVRLAMPFYGILEKRAGRSKRF